MYDKNCDGNSRLILKVKRVGVWWESDTGRD